MKTIYQCEICGSKYEYKTDALHCEAKEMVDFGYRDHQSDWYIPKVGEVVECSYPASSWWDGDEDWRVYREYGGRFLDGFYALWVVVAKIPAGDAHKWKYVLYSPSAISGDEWICWTGPDHTRVRPNRMATQAEMEEAKKALAEYKNPMRIPLL